MLDKVYSIVVVDDHLLIAKAITSIIDQFENFKVLYECENGHVLTQRISQSNIVPDIVLLDISMPIMDGFETASWLTSEHPSIMTIALTMQADEESLIRMIQSGCKGYLHKNVHPSELLKALIQVVEKGYYYPDWATGKILNSLKNGSASKSQISLTPREIEFLKYACTQLTYKEIGEKMCCSPRTVESYRDALFIKLELKTRVALALYAVKTGLYEV